MRVQCSCGSPEFIVRADSYKQNRSTSCGFCRKGGRKVAKQVPTLEIEQPKLAAIIAPQIASGFEHGSVAYFDDEIRRKTDDLIATENRIRFLEQERAQQTTTDLTTHKCWTTETASAHKLEQQIARLQIQKANAETSVKKDTRTQAEVNRDRIRALQGDK